MKNSIMTVGKGEKKKEGGRKCEPKFMFKVQSRKKVTHSLDSNFREIRFVKVFCHEYSNDG